MTTMTNEDFRKYKQPVAFLCEKCLARVPVIVRSVGVHSGSPSASEDEIAVEEENQREGRLRDIQHQLAHHMWGGCVVHVRHRKDPHDFVRLFHSMREEARFMVTKAERAAEAAAAIARAEGGEE